MKKTNLTEEKNQTVVTPKMRRIRLLLCALSGVLTGFGVAFSSLGFLSWISMIPGAIALLGMIRDGERPKKLLGAGFITFFSFYIVVYHWFFAMYPMEFAGFDKPTAALVVCVACFGLSFLYSLGGMVAFLLMGLGGERSVLKTKPLLFPFFAGLVYTVFEWHQTLFWFGVPWGRLCLSQVKCLPIVQSASLFGSYFVTFLIVTVNFYLATFLFYKPIALRRLCATVALLLFGVNFALGLVLQTAYEKTAEKSEESILVGVVQPNVSTEEKWNANFRKEALVRYCDLTRQAAAEGAQIIVWSETALPYDFGSSYFPSKEISSLAIECHAVIVVGCFTGGDEDCHNSVAAFDTDGSACEGVYSKQHLVPFGEYVPMRKLMETVLPFLSEIGMLSDDIIAGEGSVTIKTSLGDIGPLVCFDSIYETLALESTRNGAEYLVISSNDAWFRDSAACHMHLAQAQMRAIENRRAIMRSANSGISAVISPTGRIEGEIAPLTQGVLTAEICPMSSRSLYSVIGNLFVWIAAIGVVVTFSVLPVQNRIRKKKEGKI